jgi:hypothetical protein
MTDFEREDMELQFVMGGKFVDETKSKPKANPVEPKKAAEKPAKDSVMDAKWHPVKTRFSDRLKDSAKWTVVFGGLNGLILYWQIEGLMAESIALPCMLVCALLAGLNIGKAFGGGND